MKAETLLKCARKALPHVKWYIHEGEVFAPGSDDCYFTLDDPLVPLFSAKYQMALQIALESEWEFTRADGLVFPVGAAKGMLNPFQATPKAGGNILYAKTKPELLAACVEAS